MEGAFLKAYVLGYRRGCKTQNEKYAVLEVEGIDSRGSAAKLIGRKVVWTDPSNKLKIHGRIVRVHGNKGRVIAKFNTPLPGQAIGTEATVYSL